MMLLDFKKAFYFLLGIVLTFQQLSAQEFRYRKVNDFHRQENVIPYKECFDLTSTLSLNKGAVENTRIIQKALNTHKKVVLPEMEIPISVQGITLNSGNELYFRKNSKLIMFPNDQEKYELLRVHGVSNVKIVNANLKGDREKYIGRRGEWGHGISICGSTNITVDGFIVKNFWGDGLYVGALKHTPSSGILIKNGISDNNRRNGVSITSVDGIDISNIIVSNTNGTKPMYGICIEANSKLDEINRININDVISINNAEGGMVISFYKMAGKGNAVEKDVNISVRNFSDDGSKASGVLIAQVPNNFRRLTGKIDFSNVRVQGNLKPVIIRSNAKNNFKINMENVNIVKPLNANFHNQELERIHRNKKNISINTKSN